MFAGEPREPRDVERDDGSAPAEEQTARQAEQPGQGPLESTTEQTRTQTAQTLGEQQEEGKGEAQRTAEKTLEKIKAVHDKLETMHATIAALSKQARQQLSGAARETWLRLELDIRDMFEKAKLMQKSGLEITAWMRASRSPSDLYHFLKDLTAPEEAASYAQQKHDKDFRKTHQEQEEHHIALRRAITDAMAKSGQTNYNFSESGDSWEGRNESSKLMVVNMVNEEKIGRGDDAPNIGDYLNNLLRDINDQADAINEALGAKIWKNEDDKEETVEEFVKRIQIGIKEAEEEAKQKGGAQGIVETLKNIIPGVRFYSAYEVMEAFRKVKEAYVNAYKQRSSLRSDVLATQIGQLAKHLPWGGKDVPHTLDSQLDEANDKVKSHHVDYLKRRNATYEECFGAHGELAHNAHDGNIARGVLEYAASRGWLYDIDLDSKGRDGFLQIQTTGGQKLSLRSLVPENWTDDRVRDYTSVLLTQQNSGKNEETEKYYKRYSNVNKADDFVKLADEEMGNINLWAVRGIMKRAFERGLKSHISPWMITVMFQHLEENPVLRRVATKDWLDQVGGSGVQAYYTSHFTAGYLKYERDKISEWLQTGNAKNLREAGIFGTALAKVHDEIRERTGVDWSQLKGKDRQKLNEKVAQIFAGKTVEIDGKTFTIFSSRYDDYRNNEMIQTLSDLDPGVAKEDPDYYTDICENLLAGTKVVEQILSPTGRGTWTHESKASSYMTNILTLYDGLAKKGLRIEAERFRREIAPKLKNAMVTIVGDSRSPGMDSLPLLGEYAGQESIPSLVMQGFIDLEPFILGVFEPRAGVGLARAVLNKNALAIGAEDLMARLEKISGIKGSVEERKAARDEYENVLVEWRRRLSARIGRPAVTERAREERPTSGTGLGTAESPGGAAGGAGAGVGTGGIGLGVGAP